MATITSSAKRKYPASSGLDWTAHRVEIERLYLKEDKGLPAVMKFMQREHNFEASKAQYEAQFKHWGFRKNWSKEHWRYAYFKSKDRKNAGKESMIYLNNTLISQEKAKKEFRRHVTATEQCTPTHSLPECPEGLFVCTPPTVALQKLRIDNLPWIKFQSIFESECKSNSRKRPARDILLKADSLIVNPVGLGFDVAHPAHQFSLVSHEPPSPSEPSFGLGIFEDSLDEYPEPAPRSPAHYLHRSSSVYDNKSSASRSHEPLALLTSALEKYPLKMQNSSEDLQAPWALELELYDSDPVIYLLKRFLYLLSNSSIPVSISVRDYNFFDWTIENLPIPMLEALLSTQTPTAQACIEQIMYDSLRRGKRDIVRTLIGGAKNLLRTMRPSAKFDDMFAQAVRHDDTQIVRQFIDLSHGTSQVVPLWNAQSAEMVDLLVDAGTDVNTVYDDLIELSIPSCSVTAICWAVYYGRTPVVQSLLQHGADVNIAGVADLAGARFESAKSKNAKYGVTALRVAVDRVVKESEHWDDDEDLSNDDFKLIRLLLEAGAHVDTPSTAIGVSHPATPLQVASAAGHKSLARLLLDSGADVDAPACPRGNTALMASVNANHAGLVEMLLTYGAKADNHGQYQSEPRITSLLVAIEREDIRIVELLLDAGANPNSPIVNQKGFTAIELAEARGRIDILDTLVRFGALREGNGQESHQFIRAMSTRDHNCVQRLLGNDSILKGPPGARSMFLKTAINSGDKYILLSIMAAGIDINEMIDVDEGDLAPLQFTGWNKLTTYITPLGYVLSHGLHTDTKLTLVSSMLDFGANPNAHISTHTLGLLSPLHYLVNLWLFGTTSGELEQQAFYPRLIRLLLDKGACVKTTGLRMIGYINMTLLELIASDDEADPSFVGLEIAQALLDAGADVNAAGNSAWGNRNPLQEAAYQGNLSLVKLLVDHEAKVNAPALEHGETALQAAVEGGKLRYFDANSMATIDFLLEAGADVNAPPAPTNTGQPALHAAVEGENLDLIRRLIDRGADVNAAGNQNGTPIRIAAGIGNIEIAHLLIESGANVNKDGPEAEGGFTTALENAAAEGRLDMVQLLINAGADTHLPGSKRYRRAARYARKNGRIAVANFLKDCFEDGAWD